MTRQASTDDPRKRLRIFLYLHGLASHFGPGNQAVILSGELRRRGHQVFVFVERPATNENQYVQALHAAGIPIYTPGSWVTLAEHFSRTNELIWLLLAPLRLGATICDILIRGRSFDRAWRGVRGRFERFTPSRKFAEPCRWAAWRSLSRANDVTPADIVHTLSGTGCIFEWAKQNKLPVLHTEMAIPALEHGIDWWPDLRENISAVTMVAAITQAVAEGVRLHLGYTGPIELVPHFIAAPPAHLAAASSLITVPSTPGRHPGLVIVTAARLDPLKGHRYLLQAIRFALDAGLDPKIEVCLAGDGPARPEIEQQIIDLHLASQVRLLGNCDVRQMTLFWDNADVFVLPTLWEGQSVALLEAMSHSLPVIASRVGGVPEAVEHGITGLLVPPADAGALAEAINYLARHSDERRRMGDAGRRKYELVYSVPVVMEQQLQTYYRVLDDYSPVGVDPRVAA